MSKTLVCIDTANLRYYLDERNWQINWQKFKSYSWRLFGNTLFIYYDGIMCRDHFLARNPGASLMDHYKDVKERHRHFKNLRKLGFNIEWMWTTQIYYKKKRRFKRKCNFDVEITMDALIRISDYERFVLCSGDGDFVKLMNYLKSQRKRTTLIYPKDRTSPTLRKTAIDRYTLGSLNRFVGEPIPVKK